MAFNDTLFQLGMDLTRSSTAQEEDIVAGSARVESGDKNTFFFERESVHFAGSHLIVDLIGAKRLDDTKHVEATLRRCVRAAGSAFVTAQLSRAPNKGVASIDVYMTSEADAYEAVDVLRTAFGAREAVLKAHKRCDLPKRLLTASARKGKRAVAAAASDRKAA
jgi:S-adenosylmethionine decarboxylase